MDNINPLYLVMVTPENNNKYYKMIPHGETFSVEYGRIGNSTIQTASYPISSWDKKYSEKLRKGYVDQTHLLENQTKKLNKGYKSIQNPSISAIVDRLQSMARQAIHDNYTIATSKVTETMVKEAQIILTVLVSATTVFQFNADLIRLFSVIPRKMSRVADFLAKTEEDFPKIIQREQDLLDVMRQQVVQNTLEEEDIVEAQNTILEALGLDFSPCSPTDIAIIKSKLGSCTDGFYQAWKVTNKKTQERFNSFVEEEKIQDIRLLWHGSRNENWWSIINTGLVLKPTNAVITGKMFGFGCYYSPTARKSLGYTSLSGSYWAGGTQNTGFMALMSVAYGKPYDVYSFDSKYTNFNYESLQKECLGANCLHAHAGSMLKNDEIIVYKENQMTISYLVELR